MTNRDFDAHPYMPTLVEELKSGAVNRREFLRVATLLGATSAAAYAMLGLPDPFATRAAAAATGGTVRMSMRVYPLDSPHTYSWVVDSNVCRQVCDFLTRTGVDNVTRPWLLEKWEASEDLKTWTLVLKKGIKWSNGNDLVADHVIWNIRRWLDEKTGSSILGLMSSYMLKSVDTGAKDASGKPKMSRVLWSDNAIEKVDDHTIRLNCKVPQLAVPEHLFHYPALILHPSENGKFGVGSIGTGAFSMVEYQPSKKVVLKRREGYWGKPAILDTVEFFDMGDDMGATVAALASHQVDGMFEAYTTQIPVLKKMDHLEMYQVTTAQTAVARMQETHETWKDPRVRKAMRLALDNEKLLKVAYLGLGAPGEHHHASLVQPDYYKLPYIKQDIPAAKKLLAEAGHPNGFKTEITCRNSPDWELICVQAMAEMWKEIGVEVKINVLPSAQFWDTWNKPTVPFGFTPWTHRPLGVMLYGLAYRSGGVWNESYWSNAKFDETLTRAEGILDAKERSKVMKELEEIMLEDGPICLPLWRAVVTFMDKKVKGFKIHPTSYLFCEEWSV
jgi:peptide/nickel transport system substrate-binding protein